MAALHARLVVVLRRRGWTFRGIAAELGVAENTVKNWGRGMGCRSTNLIGLARLAKSNALPPRRNIA